MAGSRMENINVSMIDSISPGSPVTAIQPQYTINGVLAFLQSEWTKFESQRAKSELEKAELKILLARMEGEKQAQDIVHRDLVRRIKMLEYALKQERTKNGVTIEKPQFTEDAPKHMASDDMLERKQSSRNLIRQYLSEVGYTDTLLENQAIQLRVAYDVEDASKYINPITINQVKEERNVDDTHCVMEEKKQAQTNENTLKTEGTNERTDRKIENNSMESPPISLEHVMDTFKKGPLTNAERALIPSPKRSPYPDRKVQIAKPEVPDEGPIKSILEAGKKEADWDVKFDSTELTKMMKSMDRKKAGGSSRNITKAGMDLSAMFGGAKKELGSLGGLSLDDDVENGPIAVMKENSPKRKLWKPKYTLRSHLDNIHSVAFHRTEPTLLTGSADETVKLWSLRDVRGKGGRGTTNSPQVEPVITLRGHVGPVLSVALDSQLSLGYSAGADGVVKAWNLPKMDYDIYGTYDRSTCAGNFIGHTNAIWSLASHPTTSTIVSGSSDGTCKVWSANRDDPLLRTLESCNPTAVPTSLVFLDPTKLAIGHVSCDLVIYDYESGRPVTSVDSKATADGTFCTQINCITSHPTLPLLVAGYEDHMIRWFDTNTGKCVHEMAAHLGSVTSLAFDPTGLYLASTGHDSSIRLWDSSNYNCVQEMASHRRKGDESIHSLVFHPELPYMATGGADASLKIYS